jgi:hypothetical protein
MHRTWYLPLAVVTFVACESAGTPAPQAPPAVAAFTPAAPDAADDTGVRMLLTHLASSKACDLIRGGFHGLRAPDHPDTVTGVLWVRDCKITNAGAHIALDIKGSGWLWVDETKRKGGGSFTVRQYIRFAIATTIRGVLDLGYDQDTHVASLWLTPDRPPAVKFTTLGDINVDAEGAWSSFVGALGKTFASSPQDLAEIQVKSQGTHALEAELATGFAVTLDLCTGLSRFHLQRPPKGQMGKAGVGDTLRVPVEVQPGGVIIIGPQRASHGMTIQANAEKGAVRLAVVCAAQAEKVATAFMAGRITSRPPVLGSVDVVSRARLEIRAASCPVAVVVSALGNAPARFAWERPTSEIARSMGGPLMQCAAESKSEDSTRASR